MNRSQPSYSRCSSGSVLSGSMCDCGQPLRIYIAGPHTKNPGRRFLRCPYWQSGGSCNFFMWYDAPVETRVRSATIHEVNEDEATSPGTDSIISGLKMELEEGKKKMKKMKKNLEEEILQKYLAYSIAAVSWIVCIGFLIVLRG